MKNFTKYLIIALIIFFTGVSLVEAGTFPFYQSQLGTGTATTGYVLTSTGSGANTVASWQVSGGTGTPGGLNTQLQYNNSGSFGGITGATTDGTIVSLNAPHLLNPTINGAGTGLATLTYPNTSTSVSIAFPTTSGTLALTSQLTSGTVTSITASSPLTGGTITTTGSIGCQTASISQAGCLSSADWTTFNGKQASGNYITALTGDGTASGPGSVALTLATVNTNTGSFGSSTSIPNFTVNGKGLITAAGSNVVIAPAGTLSGTTLNSTVVTSSLTSVGTIGIGIWQGNPVNTAYGGTGCSVSSITCFNNITGLTAGGTTGTTSTNLVFSTSPTLVTPALGTPSALVGTNITGTASGLTAGNVTTNANLTGAVTSSGNATSLGSFSSANLSGALTDETGTGVSVFGTSPTFTTSIAVNGTATITGTNSVLLLGQNPASSPYFSSMVLKATGSNQGASMAIESTFGGVQDWYFGSGSGGGSPNNNFRIVDLTGGVEALDIQPATGNVGIGLVNPTARLHIKAGTATAGTAPFKLTSGINLTTPETGAMEYDGTDLFFTPTGTIRKTIPTVVTGRQTAQTGADTNVVTATVGSADASYEVSMNILVTTATLHSFTATCTYTDEGNTLRTVTLPFQLLAGTSVTSITNAQGTVPYEGTPIHIRAKGGTTITLATTGTFTTVTYNVEGAITLLQ